MTTINAIPSEAALEQNEVKEIVGGFKVINTIYEDISAVGRTVDEAMENFQRMLKIKKVDWAAARRREQLRKEYQEYRRKKYAR